MLQLIGDVIHFDGYVVGRLSSSISPTIRYAVEDRFSFSNEAHNEFDFQQLKALVTEETKDEYRKTIDDFYEIVVPMFQAGLLDRADFDKAVTKFKDELK
jgi:hypothetical protein